jgi:hypothetical protein
MKKDISSRVEHPDQHWIDHDYDICGLFVGKSSTASYNVRCRKCKLGVTSFAKFSEDSILIGVSTHVRHDCKATNKRVDGWISITLEGISFIPM